MIENVNNRTKTSIFYINDFHGKSLNMERAMSASRIHDIKMASQPQTDVLKLSSGDIMIGEDFKTNLIAVLFQNMLKINAETLGNHEFDIHELILKLFPLMKYKVLSSNIKFKQPTPMAQTIKPSVIEEINGHKYGIIGTSPVDLFRRSKESNFKNLFYVDKIRETVKDVQDEVDKLQSQGIDKIIVLSHLGYVADKILANQTQGIDVILGGHSHDLIQGIKEGENLFYSKTGEPVIITQAGRDGKNFGILNLEFDEKGVIKKAQNNIGYTNKFNRYMPAKAIFDNIIGEKEILGKINSAPPPLKNDLIEPNPHAYFIADCIKKDTDADIVLLPSSNIRGFFEKGTIDCRILNDIMPFKNKLYRVKYSEKEIVDAIISGAKSFNNIANKPGIFYASGIEYSVSTNGSVKEINFTDKNGQKHSIDIKNPKTDKYYETIINDYCAEGNDGFKMLHCPDRVLEKYNFDAVECIKNILRKSNEPVNIEDDGRIKIILK